MDRVRRHQDEHHLRHRRAEHPHGVPHRAADVPRGRLQLERGGQAQLLPRPSAGDGGRTHGRVHGAGLLPVLHHVGGHADPHVLPDLVVRRTPQALLCDQVLHLHPRGLVDHADRHIRPGVRHLRRRLRLRGCRQRRRSERGHADLPVRPAVLRLRRQDARPALPHLAAGCPRRGAHRRIRPAGGRHAGVARGGRGGCAWTQTFSLWRCRSGSPS